MNFNNIKKYECTLDEYDLTIPGYFKRKDLLLFNYISNIQFSNNLIENALEIGVYFGRVTIHLSNLDFKSVIGIDLFENQEENISQSGKCNTNIQSELLNLIKKYGCLDKIKLIKDNSRNLVNHKFNNISFYHIDGGHSLDECLSDLNLCKENSIDQTVICVDDAFNAFWPNVSAAISIFLNENKNWNSFLISDNKIYLCRSKFYDFYYKNIKMSITDDLRIFEGHFINYYNVPIIKV
jgi:hypothetical protein